MVEEVAMGAWGMTGWAVVTGGLAAGVAFLVLGFAHWAAALVLGGRLGRLWCYVVGCGLASGVYGIWCVAQPGRVPAWWGWLAWLAVLAGAGAGTLAGHGLDRLAGLRMELAMRRGMDGQQGVAADRDCGDGSSGHCGGGAGGG